MKPVYARALIAGGALASAAWAGSALAAAGDLPRTLATTAYDVGSSGYAQAVAVGAAWRNKLNVTLRVLPGKNDVSRTVPLRDGKVEFSFNGVGTHFAIEAVDVFASREWGPQDLRMLTMSMGDNCLSVLAAADKGIKTVADLKGKRVDWVKGSPALNNNTLAYLRFADLGWEDVTRVEVGGNSAAFDAIVENQADAFFSTTNSGNILKVQSSPRGLIFPPVPHADKEGWARLKAAAPYFTPHVCKESSGNLPPWEGGSYPYPVLTVYANQKADLGYAITKHMFEEYPLYKDAAPAASGYALEKQVFDWVVPFHDGAIRYYKEKGLWDAKKQAHQEALLKRVDALKKLWKSFLATNPADDTFRDKWMAYRYDGLKKAGFDPYYKEF